MATAEQKDFAKADEVREFTRGRLELLRIGGSDIGRLVLEPGWRWSEDVKPLAGTATVPGAALPVPRQRDAADRDGGR